MDPRHETLEQKTLNEVISCLNDYIKNNVDEILRKENLHADMQKIANLIYQYAGLNVSSAAILSKKNLLSVDTVLFPVVDELIIREPFSDLTESVQSALANKNNSVFHAKTTRILDDYANAAQEQTSLLFRR